MSQKSFRNGLMLISIMLTVLIISGCGSSSSSTPASNNPVGVAVDSSGNVYATVINSNQVIKYN
jgi:DNA-binding beta-propeller fold protein YncE